MLSNLPLLKNLIYASLDWLINQYGKEIINIVQDWVDEHGGRPQNSGKR